MVSSTITVFVQVLEQLLALVVVRVRVKEPAQPAPAVTLTVWVLTGPTIEPLPEMDQAYELKPATPLYWLPLKFGQSGPFAPLMVQSGSEFTVTTSKQGVVKPVAVSVMATLIV